MAKLLHMGQGALGIHTLPLTRDKDGRPDMTTVKFVHVPPATRDGTGAVTAPGRFEIDDADLARLLDPKTGDPFTKHHFNSKRILREDEPAAVETESKADESKPAADKGSKGK